MRGRIEIRRNNTELVLQQSEVKQHMNILK